MTPRSPCDRLADVVSAVDRAVSFGERDRNDEVVVAAVLHELTVVGEATNALLRDDPGLPDRRPDIPWRAIVAMRNRLVHECEKVDPDFVWGTLDDDLEPLQEAVEAESIRLGCG